jgi:transcription elongation factor Elf1
MELTCPHCNHQSIPPAKREDEDYYEFPCPYCGKMVPVYWTLWDSFRKEIWGGRFWSQGSARRWRDCAELPPGIYPKLIVNEKGT